MNLLDELLQKTSRTFALSIPLLPEDLQRSVGIAYLLFRIADTIEDELSCQIADRKHALLIIADRFAETPGVISEALDAMSFAPEALSNSGYADLLENTQVLLEAYMSLETAQRNPIASHLSRTCRGMAHYLGRDLSTGTVHDLKEYCYIVAGIVGEMLTELFFVYEPNLKDSCEELLKEATAFGEGLQLVNIIRDSTDDLHAGRCYLPRSLDRPELIELAQSNLARAHRYVHILHEMSSYPGIVRFNALNLALASATIESILEHGPGAKITREKVECILNQITSDNYATNAPDCL